MVRRVPDLSKIRRLIGYRPTRDLDQILADVLAEQSAGLGRPRADRGLPGRARFGQAGGSRPVPA